MRGNSENPETSLWRRKTAKKNQYCTSMIFRPVGGTTLKTKAWFCHRNPCLGSGTLLETLSLNTVCRAIYKCMLKLFDAKKEPYESMIHNHCYLLWAKENIEWLRQIRKCFKISLNIMDSTSSGIKRRGTSWLVISTQFKSLHLWWYGGTLVSYGTGILQKYNQCQMVQKHFRATYALIKVTSFSGKTLHISARQS